MLFDLKGRRRRVVQATYLMLAVLMGGGLVFFGIGGDVSGGLFDAFSERGGGGSDGSDVARKRAEAAERRARANPRDEVALTEVVRGYYQVAAPNVDPQTGAFPEDTHDDLTKAGAAWERYLALKPRRVEPTLAALMVQVYSPAGVNQPAKAARAAEVAAEARPNAKAYVELARYAALAGQTRKADLAGQRAVELAPRSQRSTVRALVKQAKATAATAQAGAGGGSGAGQP